MGLRLMNLPGYSPDFNADEAIWGWAREEATGNLCLGTKALVKERVGNFLCGLSIRKDEVKGRCRTVLQSKGRRISARIPAQSPMYCKCTSHLGFGLVMRDMVLVRYQVDGLTAELLKSDATQAGTARLNSWLQRNADALGRRCVAELRRNCRRHSLADKIRVTQRR